MKSLQIGLFFKPVSGSRWYYFEPEKVKFVHDV